jgi:hypothetical protein
MAEEKKSTTTTAQSGHAASVSMKQKDGLYEAHYLGSGTFNITKPKRKNAKRRQSALKGTTRGARK